MDARTSPWHGRRVLVTGCGGFLGRAVTRELLDRGANVVGLVRGRPSGSDFGPELATGQLRIAHGRAEDRGRLHSAMAVHEVSAVFHLAGTGTEPLLDAAAVYHPRIPVVTAKPAGQLRLVTSDTDDTPVAANPVGTARFGELFGGDRKLSRVVPRTVLGLLNHEPTAPSDARNRDFVFVRDAARACLLIAESVAVRGESLDLTFRSGCERNDQTMARLVAAVFAGSPTAADAVPEGNPLGWRPALGTTAALTETVAWYREFVRARLVGTRGAELRRVA